uniref:Tumor protein p53-inducible protein 11 n=1 Tax=Oryctolagus cuniculus TaxID=9986 RepID=A0A5F9CJY3_RABIT
MAAKQPPPLMKKHSQTDLVSRLKTRKVLGVGGEDDDGEVHRSKGLAVSLRRALLRHRRHGPRLPR